MDILVQLGGVLTTIIAFIVMIGIVVSIHEYGHYIVGRWVGIHAEVYSLGFGKVLASRTDKRGTVWQVAAIPLGGYVKFLGDKDASSATDAAAMAEMNDYDRRRSFPGAAVWRRALTVAAGPFANFLLSIVIFMGLVLYQGIGFAQPTIGKIAALPYETNLQSGDQIVHLEGQDIEAFRDIVEIINAIETPHDLAAQIIRDDVRMNVTVPYFLPPLVAAVEPLTPAFDAGLEAGDLILNIGGEAIAGFGQLRDFVEASEDKIVVFQVWRNGEILDLELVPLMRDYPDGQGGFVQRVMIGVHGNYYFSSATYTPNLWTALKIGVDDTWNVITGSVNSIKHIILGNISPKNLSGPLGIARVSGAVVKTSTFSYIALIATISTAIGFLNLLPIPVLDGGHLLTFAYEAVRGQPLNPKFMQVFMTIGLVLVLSLMVFTFYNDIMRL